ncbi:MAG: PSD1 domain-containing protein [Bryobacterales bacterium]|nr:PSD1 domain-containing protein [Bryobacterales bacterium]
MLAAIMLLWLGLSTLLAAQQPVFDRDVRPILERNCLGCHNQKLKMSNFSMTTRAELAKGGKRGGGLPLLLQAIRQDGNLRMPPAYKLKPGEIALLEKWIAAGAAMPESAFAATEAKPNHWSFVPVKRPAPPAVGQRQWARTPIDRFILARLEQANIAPSREASKEALLRRLSLDLTGLPPSVEELRAFSADPRPGAWQQWIDKLLDSPHYGERWARRWLDQARYADSDGGSRDEPRQIWRYRDWVIQATQNDMPFDKFVVEQLAGDLLPNPTKDQLIATGFHRNSPIQIEAGTDREQYRTEAVVDRVDTTGTVFLGLSVGCARCHDHKYDPISNREYYQLYAFFNSTDDWGEDRPRYNARFNNLVHVQGPFVEFAPPDVIQRRDEVLLKLVTLDDKLTDYKRENKPTAGDTFVKETEAEIARLQTLLPKGLEGSMIQRELPEPRQTHIMLSGDYLHKGERVFPNTPAFLGALPGNGGALNRLDFARWLIAPNNPLLARVAVNRIWQEYFGRGLVETENDFGTQGAPPTHPELLDWLAAEFIESGWSRKHIHRLILNSAVYRQTSEARQDLMESDPRNLLLARQTRLRLDSEVVRDISLASAGLLSRKVGGPSVFPPQPAAAMSASQIKKVWKPSQGEDRYRRGMYTFFWRVTPHPALIVFDAPSGMTACTRRNRSNTPLQALTLMNDQAFHEMAQSFAVRLLRESPPGTRLDHAFRVALARSPRPKERERLQSLLGTERDELATHPEEASKLLPANPPAGLDRTELAAWTSIARVILNMDEFITRE